MVVRFLLEFATCGSVNVLVIIEGIPIQVVTDKGSEVGIMATFQERLR
jgi:hypothetical protein